jgi:DNA ligase 1
MNTQLDLFSIINDIAITSSKKGKEEIIARFKNDDYLKAIFKFVYDPYIVSGLAKKKIEKKVSIEPNQTFWSLYELLYYLEDNNSGSDQVIANVQGFINSLSLTTDKVLIKSIVTKDLKIGITHKTLNKVYGKDFIREHSVMLADKYTGQDVGNYALTLKLDGTRCTAIKQNNKIKFFTRNGQTIEGLNELAHAMRHFPNDFVYDGELLLKNESGLDSATLFRETQKVLRKDGEKLNIRFILFDVLLYAEFVQGKSDIKYDGRQVYLKRLLNREENKNELLELVPTYYVGSDVTKISEVMKLVTAQGLEGLMINRLDAPYECKRSKNLLKVKEFHTIDLRIVGVEEHKHGDKLGALVVDYKGNLVNVGSGYNDAERQLLWLQREEVIGKIVEVKYFEETKNQNGGISLRFPTFERMRYDKDTVSLV